MSPGDVQQDHRVDGISKLGPFNGLHDDDPFLANIFLEPESTSNYGMLHHHHHQQQQHHHQQHHVHTINGVRLTQPLDAIQHNVFSHATVPKAEHVDVSGIGGALNHTLDDYAYGKTFTGLPNLTQKYLPQPPKSQLNLGSLEISYKWPLWQEEAKAL
jgi:hypothetical protein